MSNARILVLDEPTNDIDPIRRQLLWDTIGELGKAGATVLLVTHNLAEAERLSTGWRSSMAGGSCAKAPGGTALAW